MKIFDAYPKTIYTVHLSSNFITRLRQMEFYKISVYKETMKGKQRKINLAISKDCLKVFKHKSKIVCKEDQIKNMLEGAYGIYYLDLYKHRSMADLVHVKQNIKAILDAIHKNIPDLAFIKVHKKGDALIALYNLF